MIRYATGEVTAQFFLRRKRRAGGGYNVADEAGPSPIRADQRSSRADSGYRSENSLDLAQLDSMSANLHLLVAATDEVVAPPRHPPRHVPGAVHQISRSPERICDKTLGGRAGAAEVAPGQLRSRQVELTSFTVGDRLERAVEQVRTGTREGVPDTRSGTFDRGRDRVDRRFGGAVQVSSRNTGFDDRVPQCGRCRLATHDEELQPMRTQQPVVHHRCRHRRRRVDHVDAISLERRDQSNRVLLQFLVVYVHTMTTQQPQQLIERRIEGERRCVRGVQLAVPDALGGVPVDGGAMVVKQVRQSTASDQHTLGLACRSRGVDDIRQVITMPCCRQFTEFEWKLGISTEFFADCVGIDDEGVGPKTSDELLGQSGSGDHDLRLRVVDQISQPLGRVLRIQGHVRCARVQCREQSHHHLGSTRKRKSDNVVRADIAGPKQPGELVDAATEFCACQTFVTAHEDCVIRVLDNDAVEHVGNEFDRAGQRCSFAAGENPRGFGRRHHLHLTDGRISLPDHRVDDADETGEATLNRFPSIGTRVHFESE